MNDRVIGIIGGMGPEATANLYMKIIKATKVSKDQDHFRIIIDSNAKIPDRTKAILGLGESPLGALKETIELLEKAGVDIACIPCMTSHYFFEDMKSFAKYPIMNAFEELSKYIKKNHPSVKKVGVMATTGTKNTGLFDKYLSDFEIIYPTDEIQTGKVMKAIYDEEIGIKSGHTSGAPIELLVEAGEHLIEKGAEILISGCTEIGLVLNSSHFQKTIIDPMDVIAEAITEG